MVGSGRGAWEEYSLAAASVTEPAIIAVNGMVLLLPLVHHAVSHHAEFVVNLTRARRVMGSIIKYQTATHSSEFHRDLDHVWREFREGDIGDSSFLAVRIALALGARRVVVAGVPLDGRGHVYDDPATPPGGYDHSSYRKFWTRAQGQFAGRVFGVAGFLRELLGAPAR